MSTYKLYLCFDSSQETANELAQILIEHAESMVDNIIIGLDGQEL